MHKISQEKDFRAGFMCIAFPVCDVCSTVFWQSNRKMHTQLSRDLTFLTALCQFPEKIYETNRSRCTPSPAVIIITWSFISLTGWGQLGFTPTHLASSTCPH
ncbi:hypothetical protein AMECASPLE_005676 [Ameca splendens]|uniref:Uncharacterized protein n=1 Tax=Ameca splendens TaxID=208324 RepID=A0ABV0XC87_9TELE